MSNCIAQELLQAGKTVLYQTAPVLLESVIDYKMNKQKNKNDNIYHSVLNVDLLIIDDLGTELSNSFTVSQLYYFIEERHNNKRSTIISTNLSFSDLRERYSERIFSRFTGYYDFKQIVGTDIRIQRAFSG